MRSVNVVASPRGRRGSRFVAFLGAVLLAGSSGRAMAAGGTVTGKVEAVPAKYLEETVVYLKSVPGTYAPRNVPIDQKGMKFIPHLLAITKGDTVEFLNHDKVAHNVFTPDHEAYNLGTFKPNEKATHTFQETGVYTQLCSIHPEMLAFVFVGQNPYSAVVDAGGRYTIKDVPPGQYEIEIWNSHLKAPGKKITVTADKSTEANFSLQR